MRTMQLVMNYLVVEGYRDAAAVFERESGESPGTSLDTVASRMLVRQAIQAGNVTDAIEVCKEYDNEHVCVCVCVCVLCVYRELYWTWSH